MMLYDHGTRNAPPIEAESAKQRHLSAPTQANGAVVSWVMTLALDEIAATTPGKTDVEPKET